MHPAYEGLNPKFLTSGPEDVLPCMLIQMNGSLSGPLAVS